MTKQKTTAGPGAIAICPMNDEPITYPLAGLSAVSADARRLHQVACVRQKLERDVFDETSANRFVTREQAEAFKPTERMLAAIAELEAVHLAEYRPEYTSLYATNVHEEYTIARGRGSQLIRVRTFDEYPQESNLLAVLLGADCESRSGSGWEEVTILARHDTATDVEHSASSTARLVIRNPSAPTFAGYGRTTFTGVLTEARLYPLGTDPLAISSEDTPAGRWCSSKHCDEPHPIAPYAPPEVESLRGPRFVTVETFPMRPYLVAEPPEYPAAATAPNEITESENA